MSFTHVLFFLIYDVYEPTVSSLTKSSYACVLKCFTTFFPSLIAVFLKKPPHNRRLAPNALYSEGQQPDSSKPSAQHET